MNYGMVIDLQRCMGCQTCSTSCKLSNDVPDGIWWTRVLTDGGDFIDTGSGEYPQASMRHIPVSCQQKYSVSFFFKFHNQTVDQASRSAYQ